MTLSLIHISEPTRLGMISYAVFCLKKKKKIKIIYYFFVFFFFLMIRRPPRSTQSRSSAASDVYKRQEPFLGRNGRSLILAYDQGLEHGPSTDFDERNVDPTFICLLYTSPSPRD